MTTKVLLLNPPGKKLYLRDYYCSKTSKANYLPHPVDLLVMSGRLSERFDLRILDALAEGLDADACFEEVEKHDPDVVISLIGAVSLQEDCAFLARLRKATRRVAVSGDAVMADAAAWLKAHPFVDAVFLDFTSDEIVPYVEGRTNAFRSIVARGAPDQAAYERPLNEAFVLPVPRHELFVSRRYRYPFVKHKAFATVLTDYGCPFACSFCIMNTIGYRYRPTENVLEELRYLKKIGKREIYFSDQTFGANRERALALCRAMQEERFGFGWCCFSRADLLTDEMLAAMQAAGCHTIMMGVETADESMLRAYRKNTTKETLQDAFRRCRARKIRTVATFILGLPDETEETASATIAFARELDPDFASFNIAVPRMNTLLRQTAIQERLIPPGLMTMDQTGASVAMPSRHLTREQLKRLSQQAIRGFYCRPGYLMRRLAGISTWHELQEHVVEGWSVFRGALNRKE